MNMDTIKKPGVNSGVPEGYAVAAPYKTCAMLLIYSLVKVLAVTEERKHLGFFVSFSLNSFKIKCNVFSVLLENALFCFFFNIK